MDKKLFDKMYKTCCKIVTDNKDLKEKTGRSQVACCIVTSNNKMFTGLNIGWWHSTCAEATALANAWQAKEREIKYVMAVKLNMRNNQIESLTPCGICREMFNLLQPEAKFIHIQNGEYVVKTLDELLPEVDDFEAAEKDKQ